MGLILSIESATEVCSVAFAKDGKLIGLKETREDKSHAANLAVFIDELLKENKLIAKDLDAVAVSMGPGSYTGLRIGVSVAKGICFGGGIPLIAVPTLESATCTALKQLRAEGGSNFTETDYLCPMIDARRMEVYSSVYTAKLSEIKATDAVILDSDSYKEILEDHVVWFFGNGSAKSETVIQHPNARFIRDLYLSASGMLDIAEERFNRKQFEDVAYFEPFYLKDFIAIVSKNKVIPGL